MKHRLRQKVMWNTGSVLALTGLAVLLVAACTLFQACAKAMTERSIAVSHEVAVLFERIPAPGLRANEIVGFDDRCDSLISSHENLEISAVFAADGRSMYLNRTGATRGRMPHLPIVAAAVVSAS